MQGKENRRKPQQCQVTTSIEFQHGRIVKLSSLHREFSTVPSSYKPSPKVPLSTLAQLI